MHCEYVQGRGTRARSSFLQQTDCTSKRFDFKLDVSEESDAFKSIFFKLTFDDLKGNHHYKITGVRNKLEPLCERLTSKQRPS